MAKLRQRSAVNDNNTYRLLKVALGEAEADLAIVNGDIVNVYTDEVLKGDTVLIAGDRIAYVGQHTGQSIGANTRVIDATGKTLIPGLIDGHSHATNGTYTASELVEYALRAGTTTIITESIELSFPLGYHGVIESIRSFRNQPMKIFIVVPSMVSISPTAKEHILGIDEFRKLLRKKEVIGMGETFWLSVVKGDPALLERITAAKQVGKKIDGHSAGARDSKLQAYAACGITSCHEPTTADEVVERLRLGMFVLLREGETRRELEEVIPKIKEKNIDFKRLILATDGLGPWQLVADGYMDFIAQKAINLGLNPILAIQMTTLNVAQRFALDDNIGGIAPGKSADIVIIPELTTIKPEYVISNGQVVARDGQVIVPARKHHYPESIRHSVHLGRTFRPKDFAILVDSNRPRVKVRVIDQITYLVTTEAIVELPVSAGKILTDINRDIIKVAAVERVYQPGKTFVSFIRGIGLKQGAIASSTAWDSNDIIVVGADEADMALAINRIEELNGGIIVCTGGRILAELALPVAGIISELPMTTLSQKLHHIQQAAESLGFTSPDIRQTLCILTTGFIPYLRICDQGLFDVRQNQFVDLIVD